MKRRSFLSVSALAAVVPCITSAAEEEVVDWYGTVSSDTMEFKAEDENIVLHVGLIRPADNEISEMTDEKGDFRCYSYKGVEMHPRFWPGCSLLTRFDLTWNGKAMKIPERFWNDLPGFRIETSTLDPDKLKPELQWRGTQFLDGLERPRVSLSAEGGTVLIEWVRPEECDSQSTTRWIISKSGTVLRHRHHPHDC